MRFSLLLILSFDSFYKELSSGSCLVDNFPNHFSFYTVNHKDKETKNTHLYKVFNDSLLDPKTIIIISDVSIKNNIAISISYICSGYNILAKTIYYAVNVISTETELFAIRCRINQAVQEIDMNHIIVIIDAIYLAR